MEELADSLREALSITAPMTIEYFDAEFQRNALLTHIEDLPKEKIQLKVVTQALSWWSWALMQAGVPKDMPPPLTTRYR